MMLSNDRFNDRNENSNSFDLTDVFIEVWHHRITVLLTVFVTLVLATGYIFVAKEKWISTAIVTSPDAGQISGYTNALNVMYGNNAPKINDVQKAFIERFGAAFSALSEALDNQEEREELTIEPALKDQNVPLKLTYTGRSAEAAKQKLAEYIQQVDDTVSKGLEVDLDSSITSRKSELEQSLSTLKQVATEQKELSLAQISQALMVAEQSNIKIPQVQQMDQVSQDTMFMLGSDALSSMLKNKASRPLHYPDSYYQTRQSLLDVSNLIKGEKQDEIKADNLHSYRYVMKPTLPVRRDSPKRPLIFVLAVFLGLVIGTAIVLARNAFRATRP
ncbi:LPS O-antigen chain length determinant protein WzzB [Pluralibacter gergoviae]|uniref:LPS O-antigen chain length determinant protein WzzB n=1 Tax=Pluralibacter gergoviae TaxID=61647 RepID=UPI0039089773